MMSRILILALAFFAIADVQVALARLGNNNQDVHVSSGSNRHSPKIRKAHHSRRLLADGTGKEIGDQFQVVERIDLDFITSNMIIGNSEQPNDEAAKKKGE
mmetsp:Transcript_10502/g.18440  ORF Transcript_10502/g.18440 Transcript_10502/m.18440 type:complete len:101 (+) Transcript_10502:376-678(+)|eukprot:CAMPEP_0184427034 /NCGR_PEP_ID=MMETSP0738-20130409/170944_1 /TAXON_ID=385413 /ORGANISM="Thalassiosira miniscula, Strain CCMP1093" /LENGTH=100 /DNA_ID=CAMNT_0026790475 /DNA_START=211 /DNA_END=513 /DNA_ORIENTATION=-